MNDLFCDKQGQPRLLRGIALLSNSTRVAELATLIGFETVWLDVEHGSIPDYGQVEALCVAVTAGGGAPVVRVPDHERHHILRALEIGARILVVPMVNNAAQAKQVVEFARFPPIGSRGYNTRGRGLRYGWQLGNAQEGFSRSNAHTPLMVQIETREAVENIEEICAVEGLSGVFIGPGDLSVSYDLTGDVNNPAIIEAATRCIRHARSVGKHAGILVFPGPLLDAAIEAGADLVICGGDIPELCNAWPHLLERIGAKK